VARDLAPVLTVRKVPSVPQEPANISAASAASVSSASLVLTTPVLLQPHAAAGTSASAAVITATAAVARGRTSPPSVTVENIETPGGLHPSIETTWYITALLLGGWIGDHAHHPFVGAGAGLLGGYRLWAYWSKQRP
jgi:hypothetical protein